VTQDCLWSLQAHLRYKKVIEMRYIVISKATGKAVCELSSSSTLKHLNYDKYDFLSVDYYLKKLNRDLNGGLTYKDKIIQGLLK
jgi:hypothetical protein